jgi:hypothetical protein
MLQIPSLGTSEMSTMVIHHLECIQVRLRNEQGNIFVDRA